MSQERLDLIFKHTAFLTISIFLCFLPALREIFDAPFRNGSSQHLISFYIIMYWSGGGGRQKHQRSSRKPCTWVRSTEQALLLASISNARRPACSPEMHDRIPGHRQGGRKGEGALGMLIARLLERGRRRALQGLGRQAGTCAALEESAACSVWWRNRGTA